MELLKILRQVTRHSNQILNVCSTYLEGNTGEVAASPRKPSPRELTYRGVPPSAEVLNAQRLG